jgi:glycosyltransferase involved in cell wall biosynthesis
MVLLTLVVPTYNEAHRWNATYWEDLLSMDDLQWIFVDDGSTDNTYERLIELPYPTKYQILRLASNQGKGEAVRAGMNHFIHLSDGNFNRTANSEINRNNLLGFLDADGAIGKRDISRLLGIAKSRINFEDSISEYGHGEKCDAVWASRVGLRGRKIQRRLTRHYLGRAINSLLGIHIPDIPYDPQCGFKMFALSSSLRECIDLPFKTRWFFDLEILLSWKKVTRKAIRIWEEPLDSWQEIPGSHLSFRNSFRVAQEIVKISLVSRRINRSNERGKDIGS